MPVIKLSAAELDICRLLLPLIMSIRFMMNFPTAAIH